MSNITENPENSHVLLYSNEPIWRTALQGVQKNVLASDVQKICFCLARAARLNKVSSSYKRYTRYFLFLSQSQSSGDHFETK